MINRRKLFIFLSGTALVLSALRLPGAEDAPRDNDAALQGGMAFRVINPTKPAVPIGHTSMTPVSDIHADLRVQATVLKDRAGTQLVWLGWDFCNCNPRLVDRVKQQIQAKYGIPPAAVCINASHTHSAPALARSDALLPEHYDEAYAKSVLTQAVAVVGDALKKQCPVTCRYHEYLCTSVAIHRRQKINGQVVMRPNLHGVVDHRAQVLALHKTADRKLLGVVVKYACHPVTVGPQSLGSDYPGFMQRFFEERHPGAQAMFLQGCGADVRIQIVNSAVTSFVQGTEEAAESFGRDLAMSVEWALAKPGTAVTGPIGFAHDTIMLPMTPVAASVYRKAAETVKPYGAWGKKYAALLDRGEPIPSTWPFRIQSFCLGRKAGRPLVLVALQDEVVTEYGLNIEKRLKRHLGAGAHVIALGYSNCISAYLCTAQHIIDGGYEPGAYRFWSTPGPYTGDCEGLVLDTAEKQALSLIK